MGKKVKKRSKYMEKYTHLCAVCGNEYFNKFETHRCPFCKTQYGVVEELNHKDEKLENYEICEHVTNIGDYAVWVTPECKHAHMVKGNLVSSKAACKSCKDCVSKIKEDNAMDNTEKKTLICDMNFSTRTYNCLRRAGIECMEDLSNKTVDDVMRIRNFGRKALEELLEKMKECGVWFKED